ncbi:MAG: hypothetical protein KDI13_11340 [Alphaproteobacteria bacterium]|nr:hypothetical protein [Alphaproteobacteria bacterium]
MTDPFAPLNTEEMAAALNNKKKDVDIGTAIMPVPNDAPPPNHHVKLYNMDRYWSYLDANGHLLFHVVRFINKDGSKSDIPLTYRSFSDGRKEWKFAGAPQPRPLYGLDRLAARPDAPVIICEGEKATDAATALFLDYVTITSPGGSGSAGCTDWTPLIGRDVTIWPDNDNPGQKYAQSVARLVKKAGARSVRIVTIPDGFEEKWDVADELPEGMTHDDLRRLLDDAEPVIDPLENLVERVQADPGEAYKSDVVDALCELERENQPAYISLRSKLKKAGAGIITLEEAMQARRVENGDASEKPDHLDLALEVINHIGAENLLGTVAHVWRWQQTGVWRPVTDRALKQEVQQSLQQNGRQVHRSTVDGVADVMKNEIHAPDHAWDADLEAVNVTNGELHWNGEIWELQPHCREHYRTTQIPVIYDPQADCPRFRQFLLEIFRDDPDRGAKARALLEMIGYTLVSHAKFERFILLIGSGANGKSVIMEVVRAMVGSDNVAAVQPSQLANRFQRAHLHLKLANLVTEVAEGGEIADAELKAITSGELTTAEHKLQPPFDFCPFCTCWFGTNHMPHTRDFSDALFRRALVIPFNRKFKEGVDADPNLKTKLLDELPGIMNLALQAFGEVVKRNAFTEPESCLSAKLEWKLEADQVAQFIQDHCVLDPKYEVPSKALYDDYRLWADEGGIHRKLNRQNFTKRLVRLGCTTKKGTGGVRIISGIRIGWET